MKKTAAEEAIGPAELTPEEEKILLDAATDEVDDQAQDNTEQGQAEPEKENLEEKLAKYTEENDYLKRQLGKQGNELGELRQRLSEFEQRIPKEESSEVPDDTTLTQGDVNWVKQAIREAMLEAQREQMQQDTRRSVDELQSRYNISDDDLLLAAQWAERENKRASANGGEPLYADIESAFIAANERLGFGYKVVKSQQAQTQQPKGGLRGKPDLKSTGTETGLRGRLANMDLAEFGKHMTEVDAILKK
jgi:DNA gyrase/topoisomerase IV subunit A